MTDVALKDCSHENITYLSKHRIHYMRMIGHVSRTNNTGASPKR